MHLLLISQDFPPDVGGIQTYAYELARRLATRCEDFAVVAPARPGADAVDASLPCDVFRVRASYNTFGLKAWRTVRRLARQRGFDTVFHAQWSSGVGSLLARRFGGPRRLFVAAHGRELLLEPMAGIPLLGRLYNGIRTHVLHEADGLFPVSHFTRALLLDLGLPAECITVIRNGTDPVYFHPMNAETLRDDLGLDHQKVILTISRLVPRKGIDTVLRALARIVPHRPDVRYLIGGSGPDRERLETLARTLNLTDRVHFLGKLPRDELRRYYNVCDVFVMPSREEKPYVEGFGIAFLEANACGKPVVGARSGGIPDAVQDGVTGLLVEPDDDGALADALLRLLTDASLAARLGQNGRRRVEEEASWDHVADQLYQAIAGQV